MGSPKAMLPITPGCTLLEAHIRVARGRCSGIAVVEGAVPLAALLGPEDHLVRNPGWSSTGPFESLQCAARALSALPGPLLITPVDSPPARGEDLDALLAASGAAGAGAATVLSWRGRPGHPVLLPASLRVRLERGPAPTDGLRGLLRGARQVEASTPDVLLNLNTPGQWSDWLAGRSDQGSTV